jgi:hypothetical protein
VNIDDRLQVVKLAEIDCQTHAENAHAAWRTVKATARRSATPWRIVTVGAIAGFFMGRSGGGAAAGPGVGAKLFGTIAQGLITTLGASMTAGAAASSAADAAALATSDAVAEGSSTPEARVQGAKAGGAVTAAMEAELHQDA